MFESVASLCTAAAFPQRCILSARQVLCTVGDSHSMQYRIFWEASNSTASQEIHRISWNAKVHCHLRGNPPLVPTFNQIKPVPDHPMCLRFFFNFHLKSTLQELVLSVCLSICLNACLTNAVGLRVFVWLTDRLSNWVSFWVTELTECQIDRLNDCVSDRLMQNARFLIPEIKNADIVSSI